MKLGVLKRVPLREVWRHEGNDFSKWLAAPERPFDTTIAEFGNARDRPFKWGWCKS